MEACRSSAWLHSDLPCTVHRSSAASTGVFLRDFGLMYGTDYEIDLNAEHSQQLRDALARYTAVAHRLSGSARRPARSERKATTGTLNTTEIREWAKAQGIDVKDRGRVPAE